ncbi:cytochrome P450 [Streptacidiphilus sp. P02-A3a]|uniref:cytochrome P450 n=1 Tax=Streptacidiphilus sp. P02-A3a TaxID=2704468 RepID=UPI0015FD4563|nr:cytochrome P450 [Streptacidiphilus sp. P02-A3a]QMU69779.1 cytochrome P450 [Streptacidiphilus sp. P02-A3a]
MATELGTDQKYLYFEVDDGYSYVHRRGERVTHLDYAGGMWLIAGFEEVGEALMADEALSSVHDLPNGSTPYTGVMMPPTPIRAVPIELDPPVYKAFRAMLSSRFSPVAVRRLRPRVAQFADWCLDRHIETGAMDLFNDYIKLVPAMVTLDFIGLPVRHARIVADAVHRRGVDRFDLNPAWSLLFEDIYQALKERRRAPTDDLVSHLVEARVDGRPLTDAEIFEICFTVVIGGMSTTAKLGLGSLSYLGVHHDDRRRLIEDPSLVAGAVEEFLRYYSPVAFLARTATRDMCVAGQRIAEGDRVGLGFAAANRDDRAFECPNEVRIDRSPNRHLAFGQGVHFCIGSGLGRTEGAVMIERVLERIPDYRLSGDYQALDDLNAEIPVKARRTGWGKRLERGLHVKFEPGEKVGADASLPFSELD